MFKRATLVPAMAILAAFAAPAQSADLDNIIYAPMLPETQPVEIGSGWYLRGDLGYALDKKYKGTDIATVNPFSTTNFSGGGPTGFSEKDTPLNVSIGVGYQFTDYLRADANFGYYAGERKKYSGSGSCDGTLITTQDTYDGTGTLTGSTTTTSASSTPCPTSVSIKNTTYFGMIDGYFDLGTFRNITPYVGAGVGFAYTTRKDSASATCSGYTQASGSNPGTVTTQNFLCFGQASAADDPVDYVNYRNDSDQFSPAYSLSAGFAYQLTEQLKLDIGYKFTSAPNAKYSTFNPTTGFGEGEGIDFHEIRAGLRYELW